MSTLSLLLHQIASPVVYLLAAAGIASLILGEVHAVAAITAVLLVNTILGFVTELRASTAIAALRALQSRSARVRRDGAVRAIPTADLVPGDLVIIEAGDAVPGDIRILEASDLGSDESALTGESIPVAKGTAPVALAALLGDRSCMLFAGTLVTRGSGSGVVVATGGATELGGISRLVREANPEISPIERRLHQLSNQLVWVVVVLALGIAIVGVATGRDLILMVETGVALAVAAIPEGLPVVATLTLARGMLRMAREDALIERLSAVETLGATTTILTDKTGTLPENRMTVRRVVVASGGIEVDDAARPDSAVAPVLQVAILCNDATLGVIEGTGTGDPMEQALLRAGELAGLRRSKELTALPLVAKHAFDVAVKMMATVHRSDDAFLSAVKGAPEIVLRSSSRVLGPEGVTDLDATRREWWREQVEQMAATGLRIIACARKSADDPGEAPFEALTLVGLVGLDDPARADVPDALAACRRAGIRVVMVTGDHAVTARTVARAVGLAETGDPVASGSDIATMTRDRLNEVVIFARVSPAEKLSLVRAYQERGDIVAMTGDGVNDAPALKQADIGVAMGRRGTDAAREAAAMVLVDDAFPTIVVAIREGRVIYGNIRRFVTYLLACNLSEIMVVGLALFVTMPAPILPIQILYLNVVTDIFPAFALALGEGRPDILEKPPRDPNEQIVGGRQWMAIVLHAAAMTAATFAAVALGRHWLGLDWASVASGAFLTLGFTQLWQVFNMRSGASPFRNEVTNNPWIWGALVLCTVLLVGPAFVPLIGSVLGLVPLEGPMWVVILSTSLAPLIATQLTSAIARGQLLSRAP